MDSYTTEPCRPVSLDGPLPPQPVFEAGIRRAPRREAKLSENERKTALKNALRYIPTQHHEIMAAEFAKELHEHGKIYGYLYRPSGRLYGKPIQEYKGNCIEGKAFQVMIDNNLDFEVALYPYELITYGETGAVCQNWKQYRLIKQYLEILTDEQTLVLFSGHPVGLFHSPRSAPRIILTNGLMIGQYDNPVDYNRASAMGVSSYGQMTAGGWMYIGPQGIVHGTYNTLLNAGRQQLGIPKEGNLAGHLFVSSGLGGMSGAQGKACKIAGGVAIVAEVDPSRIKTRHDQGWVDVIAGSCEAAFSIAAETMAKKEALAVAYYGNIVDLLEFAIDNKIPIELLSDQTSCHEPYTGGYCPQGLTYDQRTAMLTDNPARFKEEVDRSLAAHYRAIKKLTASGTYFFDYGNSFMKAVFDAGIKDISKNGENDRDGFIWPSYVEDIMGPLLFDYGYGPFRWVCLSGRDEDLHLTDQAAMSCINPQRRYQDRDNYNWIRDAEKNKLVVGTKARILYSDAMGRMTIALKMNELVREGKIGPVMIGRDHHDTGGTDSPFRETSNIYDGSNVTADMATSVFAGNAARGMSLCALHNGGGTGIGKAINGGFGCVLDGSERIDRVLHDAVLWDVMAGVARRAWARNEHAIETAREYNRLMEGKDCLTLPYIADDELVGRILEEG
ncbi:MAG: urocanate hydratase [Clostridiaceae bacterium]|nr:urocanate hydratase [Clostridiaceae bacterium]